MARVAYILDTFPAVSETFVLNEILELERRGWPVELFSIHRPGQVVLHPGAEELYRRCHYDFAVRPTFAQMKDLTLRRRGRVLTACGKAAAMPRPYRWLMRQSIGLAGLVAAKGCERIHAHFATPAGQWAMCASLLAGMPYTFTAHGPHDIYETPPPAFDSLVRHAQRCITVSKFNKRYITETFHVPADKIAVVPCGIDTETFKPDARLPKERGLVVTVARLVPQKGLMYALEAARLLRERGMRFQWQIVGDGPERASLQARIHEWQLSDTVRLVGPKTSGEVRDLLCRAQVFALPSVAETLGVVYLEAMATQTPVVGAAVMGVAEVIRHGETGWLVPPHQARALADSVGRLLADPAACHKMGAAGRAHVRSHFSLASQVDGLVETWGHRVDGAAGVRPLAVDH